MIKNPLLVCLFFAFVLTIGCKKKEPDPVIVIPTLPTTYEFETTPSWSDEFTTNGLPDAAKWGYDVGGSGWGNNELQYYTNGVSKNARVENGSLLIEAHKEVSNGKNYTSARLITKGKAEFLYGRFEIKAKLPTGVGTWPAIWTLASASNYGTDYWPDNGEIDIMEHVGYDQNVVHNTIHIKAYNAKLNNQKTAIKTISTASTEFHVYRLDWTPQKLEMYIDDISSFKFENDGKGWQTWPFDRKQHLLLNIAVGGDWGGLRGVNDASFPAKMEIDYVRVYNLK
jgi:beta-glucanase (GH16 family)